MILIQEPRGKYQAKNQELNIPQQVLLTTKEKPLQNTISEPKSLKEILEKMGLMSGK